MSQIEASHVELREGPSGLRPRIVGKGVLVQAIVAWHKTLKMSPEEITANYNLTLSEVHSALAYYYDHVQEIDRLNREDEELVERMKKENPSVLQEKLRQRFGK